MTDCPDLDAAVAAGFRWARPDGMVLLSPAAPSFGAVPGLPRPRRGLRPRSAAARSARPGAPTVSLSDPRSPRAGPAAAPRRRTTSRPAAVTPCAGQQRRDQGRVDQHVLVVLVPRRHAPAPSGTNVVMSRTNRSGAGLENSVMTAQSGPTRPNGRPHPRGSGRTPGRRCRWPAPRPAAARRPWRPGPVDGRGVGQVADHVPDRDDRVRGGQRIIGQREPPQVRVLDPARRGPARAWRPRRRWR